MPTTTNYGWTTPADTDLVKDGASAIRTLGNGVDTSLKSLNPETTLGDISYRSSTANTNTRLAIGTTGQVLTVAAGVPSWATPATPSSGLNLVASGTLTAASTWNFPNNTFTSTYRNYLIVMEGRDASNNDAIYWYFRASGTNNSSSNVKFAVNGLTFNNGAFTQTGIANSYFLAGYPGPEGGSYQLTVFAPQVATYTQVTGTSLATSNATTAGATTNFSAFVNATTQYDAMGFTMSGNSYTGTYRVYGLADA